MNEREIFTMPRKDKRQVENFHWQEKFLRTREDWYPNHEVDGIPMMKAYVSWVKVDHRIVRAVVGVEGADDFALDRWFYGCESRRLSQELFGKLRDYCTQKEMREIFDFQRPDERA